MKLTDDQWSKLFEIRCRSRSGGKLSDEEFELVRLAYDEDPDRYEALSADVFDATVPFGSIVRAKRK